VSQRARRLLAVVTLLLFFGGIAVADRIAGPASDATPSAPAPVLATTQIAPSGVESSAWYCAGGTASSGVAAPTLLLVNHGDRPVTGTVHAVGTSGPGATAPITVPARGVAQASPASMVQGSDVAATVVLHAGGVGVWQEVSGISGWSVVPCASATADNWFFAQGSSVTGDTPTLIVYNPAATDAVASVTLYTSTAGVVAPAAYQGMSVPADSVVVVNVPDHVQNDPSFGASVSTLSGSVVAVERQVTQTTGLSLVPGTAEATGIAAFGLSTDTTGGSVAFHVVNPSSASAHVFASVGLQHGAAAPISMTVPPQSSAVLQGSGQTRIPPDTPYSLVFSSSVPVAVARETDAPASAAMPQVGISAAVAAGRKRWLLPPVPAPGTGAWYLAVVDLAGHPVTVSVRTPGHRGWQAVAGGRWRVDTTAPLVVGPNPPAPFGTEPLEVTASGPVAVELDAVPAGAPGVVVVPALGLG
jgi:hypothetical protein